MEPYILNGQTDRFSDAQAGACQQPQQRGEGERTHVAARAYLRNGIDQADDVLIAEQVWSSPAIEWLKDVSGISVAGSKTRTCSRKARAT
jgi:hypothetical protein